MNIKKLEETAFSLGLTVLKSSPEELKRDIDFLYRYDDCYDENFHHHIFPSELLEFTVSFLKDQYLNLKLEPETMIKETEDENGLFVKIEIFLHKIPKRKETLEEQKEENLKQMKTLTNNLNVIFQKGIDKMQKEYFGAFTRENFFPGLRLSHGIMYLPEVYTYRIPFDSYSMAILFEVSK